VIAHLVGALCYKPEGRGFETLPLTEINTKRTRIIFLWSTARPVRRAENLTAICEPIV
jgi:hypothetical protein